MLAKQAQAEGWKSALYKRQIEGFSEDFLYKVYKCNLDSWAVAFSVAKDSFEGSIPQGMNTTKLNSQWDLINGRINLSREGTDSDKHLGYAMTEVVSDIQNDSSFDDHTVVHYGTDTRDNNNA